VSSVADPDPVLFYPPDPGWSNGRIRIRDKQTKFVNSLYTATLVVRLAGTCLVAEMRLELAHGVALQVTTGSDAQLRQTRFQ
jgi:hypothetical protein